MCVAVSSDRLNLGWCGVVWTNLNTMGSAGLSCPICNISKSSQHLCWYCRAWWHATTHLIFDISSGTISIGISHGEIIIISTGVSASCFNLWVTSAHDLSCPFLSCFVILYFFLGLILLKNYRANGSAGLYVMKKHLRTKHPFYCYSKLYHGTAPTMKCPWLYYWCCVMSWDYKCVLTTVCICHPLPNTPHKL